MDSLDFTSDQWETVELINNLGYSFLNSTGTFLILAEIDIRETGLGEREFSLKLINAGIKNEVYWDGILVGGKDNTGRTLRGEEFYGRQLIRIDDLKATIFRLGPDRKCIVHAVGAALRLTRVDPGPAIQTITILYQTDL